MIKLYYYEEDARKGAELYAKKLNSFISHTVVYQNNDYEADEIFSMNVGPWCGETPAYRVTDLDTLDDYVFGFWTTKEAEEYARKEAEEYAQIKSL